MAAPVRLDPWQEIVNVGWAGGFDYIAFALKFRIEREADLQQGTGLPDLPDELYSYWPEYLISSRYAHDNPAAPVIGLAAMLGGGLWVPLDPVQVSLSGVPDPGAGAFSYFQFARVGSTGGVAVDGLFFRIGGPDIRLQIGGEVGGSAIDIAPPSGSITFKTGSTFTVEHRGDVFTGGPEYRRAFAGASRAWASCSGAILPAPYLSNASRYSAHAFDFSGVTATMGDAEYEFAGLAAREPVAIGAGFNPTLNINVLLAKV